MARPDRPLELWGGVECTIARIGSDWRDQCRETGHHRRLDDIDRIAALGLKTVRYPILWEAVAPDRPDRLDFAWTDERLARLRELGIDVIAGLCHHGSGPVYTDLLDPAFPRKLADYAARVAERYPWIERWTPVNEPLTTARFSALYGHWYPHRRDYPAFLRALVNQCLGIGRAMAAIRAAVPGARLVQTEDLGKTFSTAPLRHQARHENGRRWLSLDLLCGLVGKNHKWRDILLGCGIAPEELEALETAQGRPDLIGINHYLTSERYLDHRLHLYPELAIGTNGRDHYVDAEAVRVKRLERDVGLAARLREVWARYRLPLAVTEVHHGCHRDEQLRWFAETWRSAQDLRAEGIDVRAVTLWSLFGNVDWRSLLTERRGWYDPGAYDARGPEPRPTALAAAASVAAGGDLDHPALDSPGWWRRPSRLYAWCQGKAAAMPGGRPILVTGATGTLGKAFATACAERALASRLTDRAELDICDEDSIERALAAHRPWAVINAAGFVRVADAERERDACMAWNAEGPERLALACAKQGIPFVTFSSDLVFDGGLGRPCTEPDPVAPRCVYGASKAEAERRVLAAGGQAMVVRTAAFFGPEDRYNFAWQVRAALERGGTFRACPATIVSPTWVPDLCHVTLDLLIDGETGLWHLANEGEISWYDFARRVAEGCGFDPSRISAAPAPEARITALATTRGQLLRPFAEALDEWIDLAGAAGLQAPLAAE